MIKNDNKKARIKDKNIAKSKKLQKKKIIVRNLSFKVSEEDLKKIFSQYGKVLQVNIPLNKDGRKRGFAFVQFEDMKSLIKSMKALNYKPIEGRPVAIDYALNQSQYLQKVHSMKLEKEAIEDVNTTEIKEIKSEPEDDDDSDDDMNSVKSHSDESVDEKRANKFLKEFGIEEEDANVCDDSEDSDDDSQVDDDDDEPESKKSTASQKHKKKDSHDICEGKTIFIRNVSFTSTEEDLQELMEEYGECQYCLVCIDKLTDHPKGTAFVKFKEKDSAEKLVADSEKDPGIILDGRKLDCSYAVSREDIAKKSDVSKKPKDKRNLNLLKCSVIVPGSKEAEGVSRSDMAKRLQLEMSKKEKLKRNTNFCVSDKRIIIHNLPEELTDIELRKLCKTAAGKGTVITEARIMKDFRTIGARGIPTSKGFGFVSFINHEDALKALQHLNNNPNIFTPHKRPIVEFSIENKIALLSKERRKEKTQLRYKRRTEEKNERKAKASESSEMKIDSSAKTPVSSKKNKKKKKKLPHKISKNINRSSSEKAASSQASAPRKYKKAVRRRVRKQD